MSLTTTFDGIPAMSDEAIATVRRLEAMAMDYPQEPFMTHHVIHGGVYLRTLRMLAGSLLTGALIKISTTLIVSGDATLYMDAKPVRFTGYHVLPASAGRKQAILAHEDTDLTMLFGTSAKTVEEAEAEFTDEVAILTSNKDDGSNTIMVTGE
tara:strand:+ start:4451 stop:4909 length:459 start_codon:yes stop_codon:yes gene_type:complete